MAPETSRQAFIPLCPPSRPVQPDRLSIRPKPKDIFHSFTSLDPSVPLLPLASKLETQTTKKD